MDSKLNYGFGGAQMKWEREEAVAKPVRVFKKGEQ